MEPDDILKEASDVSEYIQNMASEIVRLQAENDQLVSSVGGHGDFFVSALIIFVLACFVGYYVVWRVTPALHSPLMGITNAISSVIIVGAILAAGAAASGFSGILGFLAVTLASVNIFGGFIITNRMLSMFKKKK